MYIQLIRHGESFNNALPAGAVRIPDPPLTAHGRAQAEMLAAAMSILRGTRLLLLTSPALRALETAFVLAGALDAPAEVWASLRESGDVWVEEDGQRRALPGMGRAAMSRHFPTFRVPADLAPDGWGYRPGSTPAEEDARAAIVAESLRALDTEVAIVVGHNRFGDRLLGALLGWETSDTLRYPHAHASARIVDLGPPVRLCTPLAAVAG